MKTNNELTPQEVKTMPLKEFEERFGFSPESALEKCFFAGFGKRPSAVTLKALEDGVIGPIRLEGTIMK